MGCVARPFAERSSTVPVRLTEGVGVVDAGGCKDNVTQMHFWKRSGCCKVGVDYPKEKMIDISWSNGDKNFLASALLSSEDSSRFL